MEPRCLHNWKILAPYGLFKCLCAIKPGDILVEYENTIGYHYQQALGCEVVRSHTQLRCKTVPGFLMTLCGVYMLQVNCPWLRKVMETPYTTHLRFVDYEVQAPWLRHEG